MCLLYVANDVCLCPILIVHYLNSLQCFTKIHRGMIYYEVGRMNLIVDSVMIVVNSCAVYGNVYFL